MGENTPTVIKHVVGKRARQYHKLPQALGLPCRTTPARFSETLPRAPGTAIRARMCWNVKRPGTWPGSASLQTKWEALEIRKGEKPQI